MVRGLSFQKGIMFIGKKHVACSYKDQKVSRTWIKPLNFATMVYAGKLVIFSMPWWFHLLLALVTAAVAAPYFFSAAFGYYLPSAGLYILIFFLFGTHFWFPTELKKYHGAEHKVFSCKKTITIRNKKSVKNASITNRYCSTNAVMVYFLLVTMFTLLFILFGRIPFLQSLEMSAYLSLLAVPFATYLLNRTRRTRAHDYLLRLSYFLQRNVTTSEPEDRHIQTAVRAYRKLALKEFPEKIMVKRREREVKYMAIADVTIMPLGSETTSVSDVVAEIQRKLQETDLLITYEMTPMSTLIEGNINDVYTILREIQEVPFQLGHKRAAVNIRIDDRRDKPASMTGKMNSVKNKIKE